MASSQNNPNDYTGNTQNPRTIAAACCSGERGRSVRKGVEHTHPRYVWALVTLAAFALLSGWMQMAMTQTQGVTVTLVSAADTTLKQGTPNTNQGTELLLRIQHSGTQRVLVRFDQQALEQVVGSSSIRSAKVRLFISTNGNNWGTDGREVNVHRLTQAWTEAGATWNCPNDTNTGNGGPDCNPSWEMGGNSLPPFAIAPTHVILHQNNQTGWVEWDVTGDVRKFLAHEASNYGWIIRKDDEGVSGQVDYASRENTNAPQLIIELGEPNPPVGSGLTAVSDADVRSGSPNQNQGNRMRLQAQSSGSNRALVQFGRQAMLATVGNGTLQTAKLRLYVVANANNWGSSGRAVNVHRMTQAWTEQGTTWNCANDLNPFNSQSDCTPGWNMSNSSQWPFVAAATHSIVQQNNQTGWVEWDVTSDVAQILSASVPNYGWLIRKDNEGQAGQVEYGSRESQNKPELVFTVQANNLAPQVSAGSDQTITLPNTASLTGTGSDDGLPSGSSLSYSWSQVSGPGTASFDNSSSATTVVTFTLPGTYALKLTVSDSQLSAADEVTIVVNPPPPVNLAPQVSAGPDQTITLPATVNLNGSVSDDGLPTGGVLSLTWSVVSDSASIIFGNASQATTTATFTVAGSYVLRLTASDSLLSTSDDVTITVNPPSQHLPPDPVTVAPPLDRTVATTLFAATEFLYSGSNPIQTGVVAGTITPVRAAVLRGKVITRDDGAPLPGVKITVLNHQEFGSTQSRADGMFDMAVNGGSLLTVNYEKSGFPSAQRQIKVAWQDYVTAPTVAMVPYDNQVTAIDLGSPSPIQVAQSSLVTDSAGARRSTLLFRSGTAGTLIKADGSSQPISTFHVRSTEFTVGSRGTVAMPAPLPPNSAYTYCVELSVDEAVSIAAKSVRFSQPVIQYVENYYGFPTGTAIPEGYYDSERAVWVASDNGVVVYILSIADGQANLDLNGSNTPATPEAYSALGITGPERQQLATLYQPGQSLWRVPIPHFTKWDSNLGFSAPNDGRPAGVGPPSGEKKIDCHIWRNRKEPQEQQSRGENRTTMED
jgi:K319L-like, PKD domain